MSVSFLPWACCVLAIAALFSGLGILIAIFRGWRLTLWLSTLALVAGSFGAYGAFSRLQRIHGALIDGDSSVKTKEDLISHYGSPTRKKMMMHDGIEIEAWIYEIKALQPHVLRQFEMVDGKIIASALTNYL